MLLFVSIQEHYLSVCYFKKEGQDFVSPVCCQMLYISATAGHKSDSAGSGNVTSVCSRPCSFITPKSCLISQSCLDFFSLFFFPQLLRVSQESLTTLLRSLVCLRREGRIDFALTSSLLPQTAGYLSSKIKAFHSKLGFPPVEMEFN